MFLNAPNCSASSTFRETGTPIYGKAGVTQMRCPKCVKLAEPAYFALEEATSAAACQIGVRLSSEMGGVGVRHPAAASSIGRRPYRRATFLNRQLCCRTFLASQCGGKSGLPGCFDTGSVEHGRIKRVLSLALPGFILHDGAFAKMNLVCQWAWIEKVLKQMTGP